MKTIKYTKNIRVALIISVIFLNLASCNAVRKSPTKASTPTTSSPTFIQTPTLRPSSVLASMYTSTTKVTATSPSIQATFGTPLPVYKNVPIPIDAIAGMDEGSGYQFITKQTPFSMYKYYIDVLPLNGWEIQQITIMDGNLENAHGIWLAVSSNQDGLVGVINIKKQDKDEFTSVHMSFINPD